LYHNAKQVSNRNATHHLAFFYFLTFLTLYVLSLSFSININTSRQYILHDRYTEALGTVSLFKAYINYTIMQICKNSLFNWWWPVTYLDSNLLVRIAGNLMAKLLVVLLD